MLPWRCLIVIVVSVLSLAHSDEVSGQAKTGSLFGNKNNDKGGDKVVEVIKDRGQNCIDRRRGLYCCGNPTQYFRMVDGVEEKLPGYPWITSIMYKGKAICGGTLINEEHILTAADCLLNDDKKMLDSKDLSIEFPATDASSISNATVAKFFSFGFGGDNKDSKDESKGSNKDKIAVIVLQRPIDFNDERRPICLPAYGKNLKSSPPAEYVKLASEDCETNGGNALYIIDTEKQRYTFGAILTKTAGCARGIEGQYIELDADSIHWVKENTKDSCYCDDD